MTVRKTTHICYSDPFYAVDDIECWNVANGSACSQKVLEYFRMTVLLIESLILINLMN